ncbi:MAG: acrylyl-CoA reductase [Microbacteriaceae bacterium]|jgi:acrylyl-CoA reductase (NADPH)|nr:acrylyl-CoA reductase [Microbacteriaceae bacterium]
MFRALKTSRADDRTVAVDLVELTDDDLAPGDVTIDVEYSSLNFKDALALAGKPGVIRSYPLIPGIDLVGTVASSEDPRWNPGDAVVLNGWGIGEEHDGGLAERARVSGDWLVALPAGLDPKRAAAIGTAGFTAMLAVLALERAGVIAGDILVTGAAGGVGSMAVALLSAAGYRVVASTGRPQEADYLRGLGASDIIDRATLSEPGKPLQSQRWAGAIDSVGGSTLANVLAQTSYGGTVASCGLAQSGELPATVMPFILRAVTLTGINSVFAPRAIREDAWRRLATDLQPRLLDEMTSTIGLADAVGRAADLLAGRVRGRLVVDVHG